MKNKNAFYFVEESKNTLLLKLVNLDKGEVIEKAYNNNYEGRDHLDNLVEVLQFFNIEERDKSFLQKRLKQIEKLLRETKEN